MSKRIGAVLVVALAACGGSAAKSQNTYVSCDRPSINVCMDFVGLPGSNPADLPSSCGAVSGTFSTAKCSTASVMGNCTILTGSPGIDETIRYYSPAWDWIAAERECVSGSGSYQDLLPHASCDLPAGAVCQEQSGLTGADATAFQSSCASASGTFSTAICSPASRVGTCVFPDPQPGISDVIRYYSSAWTAFAAQVDCENGSEGTVGVFTPN